MLEDVVCLFQQPPPLPFPFPFLFLSAFRGDPAHSLESPIYKLMYYLMVWMSRIDLRLHGDAPSSFFSAVVDGDAPDNQDWDKLMMEYEGSSNVLIADVDCVGSGKSKWLSWTLAGDVSRPLGDVYSPQVESGTVSNTFSDGIYFAIYLGLCFWGGIYFPSSSKEISNPQLPPRVPPRVPHVVVHPIDCKDLRVRKITGQYGTCQEDDLNRPQQQEL